MKRFSPASERNKDPILDVLRTVVPASGHALELSAGSGQHSVHFAAALPGLSWQPTDIDPTAIASVTAYREEAGLPNLLAPRVLDVTDADWALPQPMDLITSINMIHISPWAASEGLFTGAGRHLAAGGVLVTYGPYNVDGAFTAESNARFDASLRSRDAAWGIRDLDDLLALATAAGLTREALIPMPANNFTVVYRKAA